MEPALQDFERKFKVDQFLIAHVAGWRVSLRTSQTTLGAVVVSSRNGTPRMEMLDDEAQAGGLAGPGLAAGFGGAAEVAHRLVFLERAGHRMLNRRVRPRFRSLAGAPPLP